MTVLSEPSRALPVGKIRRLAILLGERDYTKNRIFAQQRRKADIPDVAFMPSRRSLT
jgi:hypothetical protein